MAGLAPRYAFQVAETDAWLLLFVIMRGAAHQHAGEECEDGICLTTHGRWIIAVLADGVSDKQCTRSGEGARIAVQLAASAIARALDAGAHADNAIPEAFSFVHNTLTQRTKDEGAFWATYACTLAAAVIDGTAITAGHVGDCSAFAFDGKRLTRIATAHVHSAPTIILHPNWRNDFALQTLDKPYVKAFALTTDGCANFFMGRERDDATQTNPAITTMLLDHVRENSDPFHIMAGINALLRAKDHDSGDDRSMFWAFLKEKPA